MAFTIIIITIPIIIILIPPILILIINLLPHASLISWGRACLAFSGLF
jgi:hypothetical protein